MRARVLFAEEEGVVERRVGDRLRSAGAEVVPTDHNGLAGYADRVALDIPQRRIDVVVCAARAEIAPGLLRYVRRFGWNVPIVMLLGASSPLDASALSDPDTQVVVADDSQLEDHLIEALERVPPASRRP